MIDFVNISIVNIIDILLVGLFIFQAFKIIRGTSAMSIFAGILAIYVTWLIVKALNMTLLSSILGQVLGVGVIALIILFQQEIRRFLLHIGNIYFSKPGRWKLLNRLFGRMESDIESSTVDELTQACRRMSEMKTGALIVLGHQSSLDFIVETGDKIDAIISRRLIENIFWKNTPLHDGAMIIENNRILAARCTLPITDNPNIGPQYGMRHRAALGISEKADVDVIVVSEETGKISYVNNGVINTMGSISELKLSIEKSYKVKKTLTN